MVKWKEPTTEVAVTDVDPRVRMKKIRADVKAFLKGDTLGLAMWQLGATLGFVSGFFKSTKVNNS